MIEYTEMTPLSGGNVPFSTLEGRPGAYQFEDNIKLQVSSPALTGSIIRTPGASLPLHPVRVSCSIRRPARETVLLGSSSLAIEKLLSSRPKWKSAPKLPNSVRRRRRSLSVADEDLAL